MDFKSLFESSQIIAYNSTSFKFTFLDGTKLTGDDALFKAERLSGISIPNACRANFHIEAKEYFDNLKDLERETKKEEKRKKKEENKRMTLTEAFDFSIIDATLSDIRENVFPMKDKESGKIIFYNKKYRIFERLSPDVYRADLEITKDELASRAITGYAEYNPKREEPLYTNLDGEGRVYYVGNTHNPALWRKRKPSNKDIKSNLYYKLTHNYLLTPEMTEKSLDWMHETITGRNQTVLVVIGSKGSGKGLVAGLIKQLVGPANACRTNKSIFEDKFNEQLDERQFVLFDEAKLGLEEMEIIKNYTNDEISIEGKGLKVKTVANHGSYMITNNSLSNVKFSPDERRISLLEPRRNDINTVINSKYLKQIAEMNETKMREEPPQELIDFGHWLLQRKPLSESHEAFKGDYFYKVTVECLDPSEKFIAKTLIEKTELFLPEILIDDIKTQFSISQGVAKEKVKFIGLDRLKKFISTFKYYDQELMAEIVSKPYIPNGSKANVKEAKKKDYLIPRPEFLALLKRLNNEDEIDL